MIRKNIKNISGVFLILVMFSIFLSAILISGKNNAQTVISEEDEILKVVKLFWELTEKGDFKEAHSLTTNSFNGITVEVKNQEPVEEWLHRLKIKPIFVEMHKKINDVKCVVRVKVQRDEKKYYLFHDLVKNEKGEWKIISTSN